MQRFCEQFGPCSVIPPEWAWLTSESDAKGPADCSIVPSGHSNHWLSKSFFSSRGFEYGLGIIFCHRSEYARFGRPCN
jgi:hypothetical protein